MLRFSQRLLPLLAALNLIWQPARADDPAWWAEQGLANARPAKDSAPATIGQLKNAVWSLARALDAGYPAAGGAGTELRGLARSWDRNFPAAPGTANWTPDVVKDGAMLAVANQGQLKNLAMASYRRLKALGLQAALQDKDSTTGAPKAFIIDPDNANRLPWSNGRAASDSSPALLGQLKYCFSFEITDLNRGGQVIAWQNGTLAAVPAGLNDVVAVAAGTSHNLALKSDGTVVAWGYNSSGQATVPTGLKDVVAIAAGRIHSVALKKDGTVVAWGEQKTQGPYETYTIRAAGATLVPGDLKDVVAIASGEDYCLAIKYDGTVTGWGARTSGLFGGSSTAEDRHRNDYGQTRAPAGLANGTSITGGIYHSLGISSDDVVTAWGASSDPDVNSYAYWVSYPTYTLINPYADNHDRGQTTVPAGLKALGVAAFAESSLALKTDGTVTAWGGSPGTAFVAPPVAGHGTQLSAGLAGALLLKTDGSVVQWNQAGTFQTVPDAVVNASAVSSGGMALAIAGPPAKAHMPEVPAFTSPGYVLFGSRWNTGIFYRAKVVNGPATFAATNLPAGLVLDPVTGIVSGEPTVTGTYDTVFTATNAAGTGRHQVRFHLAGFPLVFKSSTDIQAPEGSGVDDVYYRARVETGDVRFSATGLPAGLTIDPVTGVIRGTPSITTPVDVVVTATHSSGSSSITVRLHLENLLPKRQQAVAAAFLNEVYSKPLTYSRATNVVVTGLPPGLTYASAEGLIKGVAGQIGSFPVTIQATGPFGVTTETLNLDVRLIAITGYDMHNISQLPAGMLSARKLSYGQNHLLILKHDGTVAASGDNSHGQSSIPAGLSGVVDVAGAGDHNLVLKSDGSLAAWGDNAYGQSTVPGGLSEIAAISADATYNVILKRDGTLRAWGDNFYGQVSIPEGLDRVTAIVARNRRILAIRSDGTVVTWGSASTSGIGPGNPPAGLSNVVSIAIGGNHGLALKRDGTVVGWGYNDMGQTQIPAGLSDVVAIAAGSWHSLALKRDGSVVAWGSNSQGSTTIPAGMRNVTDIQTFNVANVWMIGESEAPAFTSTTLVPAPEDENISGVYYRPRIVTRSPATFSASGLPPGLTIDPATGIVSGTPTTAVDTDAVITATNTAGATSLTVHFHLSNLVPKIATSALPEGIVSQPWSQQIALRYVEGSGVTVSGLPGGLAYDPTTRTISGAPTAGGPFNVIITATNSLATTRRAISLTVHSTVTWTASNTPQPVVGLLDTVAVSAGEQHTLALSASGAVKAWGDNSDGQTTVPPNAAGVVAISAGISHSMALRLDGTVVVWGSNRDGQLNVPAGLSNVVAIAAGGVFCLALKSDGTVVAWGGNSYGQSTVPAGLGQVVAISAGRSHALALKADGTLTGWGRNDLGQATNWPAGLSGVAALAGGSTHSLALTEDGHVTFWPSPGYGYALPAGLDNVTAINAYFSVSQALKKDGSVVTWGNIPSGYTPFAGLRAALVSYGKDPIAVLSEPGAPPRFTSSRFALGFQGVAGVQYRAQETSGNATFTAAGLPAGLTMDATLGTISGMPAPGTGGSYNLTITVSNVFGVLYQPLKLYVN